MSDSPAASNDTTAHGSSGPVRRCVVCRQTHRKRALMRFVVSPAGELLFDVRQKLPGRGLNVCPTQRCLEAAARGAFKRGARGATVDLPTDLEGWIEQLVLALDRHYAELVSSGRQSGQLRCGAQTVERMARGGELVAYMLATDASAGTRRKYSENARRKDVPVHGQLNRKEFGRLTGRDEVVVSGWVAGALYSRFASVDSQIEMLKTGVGQGPHTAG